MCIGAVYLGVYPCTLFLTIYCKSLNSDIEGNNDLMIVRL